MRRLLAVIFLLLCALGSAHAGSVHLLLSDNTDAYLRAAEHIQHQLSTQSRPDKMTVSSIASAPSSAISKQDLIVSIGEAAVRYSQQHYTENPQLYSYVDNSVLPLNSQAPWAAVLLEQPLQRRVDTAVSIASKRYNNKIVIAVSDNNQAIKQAIDQLIIPETVTLDVVSVEANIEPARQVDKALFNAGVLIAVRDPHIWSGENAKWMLYQSYKYKVPVIGYSRSFLKAGALLSVYAALEDVATTTADIINDWHDSNGKLSREGPHYPPMTISVNKNIARALNLSLPENLIQGEQANVRH